MFSGDLGQPSSIPSKAYGLGCEDANLLYLTAQGNTSQFVRLGCCGETSKRVREGYGCCARCRQPAWENAMKLPTVVSSAGSLGIVRPAGGRSQ